jgi:hypothetical protein
MLLYASLEDKMYVVKSLPATYNDKHPLRVVIEAFVKKLRTNSHSSMSKSDSAAISALFCTADSPKRIQTCTVTSSEQLLQEHEKLGHISMTRTRAQNDLPPADKSFPDPTCPSCSGAAMRQGNIPKLGNSQASRPHMILAMDTSAKYAPDQHGNQRALRVLDKKTGFVWTLHMQRKSQAARKLAELIDKINNICAPLSVGVMEYFAMNPLPKKQQAPKIASNDSLVIHYDPSEDQEMLQLMEQRAVVLHPVAILRSDGAKEYVGGEMKTALDYRGVTHQVSKPNCQYQNGAEPMMKDIQFRMKAQMIRGGAPGSF